jgi:DNA-binding FadR family transcriptional regulator
VVLPRRKGIRTMKPSAEIQVEDYLIKSILNKNYQVGSYLPPERELSEKLGFSRPVVHKAIIRLEGKGLVTIRARQGVLVNDYRTSGKLELLEHLYVMYRSTIDPQVVRSTQEFIRVNFLNLLKELISERGHTISKATIKEGSDIFQWMKTYALLSDNIIYAMIFNEFKVGIVNVANGAIQVDRKRVQTLVNEVDDAMLKGDKVRLEVVYHLFFDVMARLWMEGVKDGQ